MKKKSLLLSFLFLGMITSSQNNLNKSLGNLSNIKKNNTQQTFTFQTEYGAAVVSVYNQNIFRVRIAREFGPDLSWAVVGKPARVNIDYSEDKNEFIISTDSLVLQVSKNPVRFTFKTKDGKIINQDDPAFGTSWIDTQVTTYKTLMEGEKFIGLGEKTGNLNRRGSAYVNWNTDNPHYDNNSDPLYATVPFYVGIHDGLNYGIFLDNSYRTRFNFGASNDRFSYFSADDGEMDYYFIFNTNVADIIKSYTWLTGRMELPPLWSLGYQQCRWSYTPDSEALNIAKTFREKKIPADVIYLDIDYMDAYKIFTWHPENFPHPEKLINELKALGFKTVVIIDPGIKVETAYQAYDEGIEKDYFIKYPDGTFWTAQVWPGWCHFPDFTDPEARQWWGEKFEGLVKLGIEGFWNDMNEIACWGQQSPSLLEFDWEGNKTTYRQAKNVYGTLMARSTFEGVKKLMNGKRPLIITRAGYAGLQRYTSIWTGDNQATDHHMMLGIRLVNSLGLSGISFTGSDVGGFGGNATPELFARWISIGAFTPFFRGHSAINTASSEPWVFGERVENIARNYIRLRYKLLPYIYTAMHESAQSGLPLNRSLAIDYTFDENIYNRKFQNQYLFGPSILVAPVESVVQITNVYLPDGDWYNFFTDEKQAGNKKLFVECPLEKLPLFVKAGSIIPMQSVVQHTGQKPSDTLVIHVYKSEKETDFVYKYYEDDGVSYDYKEGKFYKREIIYKTSIDEIIFKEKKGEFESKFKALRLVFHGFTDIGNIIKVDGKPRKIYPVGIDFLEPAPSAFLTGNLNIQNPSIIFQNSDGEIVVNW